MALFDFFADQKNKTFTKSSKLAHVTYRPKFEDRHWYSLKTLLEWADNLGRCVNFGHDLQYMYFFYLK
jgi:hypothetical protein